MKWIRGAIILTVLTLVLSVRSIHTDRCTCTEESAVEVQTDVASESSSVFSTLAASSPVKWQLKKTSLFLHSMPPEKLYSLKGESAFLECLARGIPAPTIHWLKDGVIISQIEESIVSDLGVDGVNTTNKASVSFTASRLYLDCLSVEDEGLYSCVAKTPYQRMNSTNTTLTVLSSDEKVDCRNKSHGQAPRIVQWTTMLIGIIREPSKMTCRADGNPSPTIRWFGVNGEELTTADFRKYQVLPEGDLVIHEVEWSDMGTFTCLAENLHGEAKSEVFIYPAAVIKYSTRNVVFSSFVLCEKHFLIVVLLMFVVGRILY